MKVEVLISCMHQKDVPALIKRTNIQSDVLVINQCDVEKSDSFEFANIIGEICKARIIYTKERGLSRSRNMAIRNATGDLCLICDDDEELVNDYADILKCAYKQYLNVHIMAFKVNMPQKTLPSKTFNIGIFRAAKIHSVQICFKRKSLPSMIQFCEKMGSGTDNGGGEENKFLIDCIKAGLKIRYVPYLIGSVAQTESQWFHGFDRTYWINRGWTAKMIYGYFIGYLYLWYTLLFRSYKIDKNSHWYNHVVWLHKGFFEHR